MHLVMFDTDGTLTDSDGFEGALYSQAIHEHVEATVDETWYSYRHVTDSGVLLEILQAHVQRNDIATLGERIKQRFIALTEAHIAQRHWALEFDCRCLRAVRGAPCSSRRRRRDRHRKLARDRRAQARRDRHRAWQRSVRDRVGGHLAAAIMGLAEQRAKARGASSRRTYFGDAPWDQAAGIELGYDFVGVGTKIRDGVRFDDLRNGLAITRALGLRS